MLKLYLHSITATAGFQPFFFFGSGPCAASTEPTELFAELRRPG